MRDPRQVPPERLEGDGVLVRRWVEEDAASLDRAVTQSREHLRPWMPWIAQEPQPLEQRMELIARWAREWSERKDFVFGVFVGDEVAGGCGLHRRGGRSTLEIGYWLHPAFTGRGLATTVSRLLTDAAFSVPGIDTVEIHSDKANTASARVPSRLGFELVGESPDEIKAPGEVGIDCAWRMDRASWR